MRVVALWVFCGAFIGATATATAGHDKAPSRCAQIISQEFAARSRMMTAASGARTALALCTEAQRVHQDPLLVLALIGVESTYNPHALSPRGAQGLMQLLPATALAVARRDHLPLPSAGETEPALNVRLGVTYFSWLQADFGRKECALLAYNLGPFAAHARLRGAQAKGCDSLFVVRVLRDYEGLRKKYKNAPLV